MRAARPHAYGSSGNAAARATPAAIPTDVSRIDVTSAGTPAVSATCSAARTPPSGWTFRTTTSAAWSVARQRGITERADALVGGDGYVHATPESGEVVERGDGLLDELDVEACEPTDHRLGRFDVPRAVGVDA